MIFVYNNIIGNYCSGDYYFIAPNRNQAFVMSNAFAKKHNEKVNNNSNYTIEWDEEPKKFDIVPGYLPLNRVVIDVTK